MNRIFLTILLISAICIELNSCSSGAYDANPSSPANQSINPLNPLKASQFTWSGTSPLSADINGTLWVADSAWAYADSAGEANLVGVKYSPSSVLFIHFPNAYGGGLYNMGYDQLIYAEFADSVKGIYQTYFSTLGNSGELCLSKTVGLDTVIGKFYFQGVATDTGLINVTNGYINIE